MVNSKELDQLRSEIDVVDQELLALIQKRLSLVAKVGHVKYEQGIPLYAPDREEQMLEKRKNEALSLGISPQLIEDILRRLMRESYIREKNMGFKKTNLDIKSIVIIGGLGQLGKLFANMFKLSGYIVNIIDKNDWDNAELYLKSADLVIVTVPIKNTIEVIEKLTYLPADCILADLTSIKVNPIKSMLKTHVGPVVGLHPMFGPDANFAKQIIVVCDGRHSDKYQWLLDQISIWGAKIVKSDAKEHDEAMQVIQAMRHFSTYVYGVNLYKEKVSITNLLKFSSPIYRLELAMVGRLFAQDPNLYADIILSQKDSITVIEDYLANYKNELSFIKNGDKEQFIEQFNLVSRWFGDHAKQFLDESKQMLLSVNDMKK